MLLSSHGYKYTRKSDARRNTTHWICSVSTCRAIMLEMGVNSYSQRPLVNPHSHTCEPDIKFEQRTVLNTSIRKEAHKRPYDSAAQILSDVSSNIL